MEKNVWIIWLSEQAVSSIIYYSFFCAFVIATRFMLSSHFAFFAQIYFSFILFVYHRSGDIVSAPQKCSGPWMCANTASKLQFLSTVAWEFQTLRACTIHSAETLQLFFSTHFLSCWLKDQQQHQRTWMMKKKIHKAPRTIKIIYRCM